MAGPSAWHGRATKREISHLHPRPLRLQASGQNRTRSPLQSLKIEGRMKSPEYVAIVTSIYRKALDEIAKGSWSPSPEDERDLALAFNRDFTEGHLLSARDVMGRQMSDNQEYSSGSVASYDLQRGEAVVRLSGPLAPKEGDGLVFLAPGQEMGLVVQSAMPKDGLVRLKTPERVRPGARVYLTGSTSLARRRRRSRPPAKRRFPSISSSPGRMEPAMSREGWRRAYVCRSKRDSGWRRQRISPSPSSRSRPRCAGLAGRLLPSGRWRWTIQETSSLPWEP